MGRPLNKKYFGNRNIGTTGTADNGIGGEGLASITIGSNNSTGYAANDPLIITAPQLPGGVQAVAKIATVDGDGKILTIEVTETGSGYTSAPTVTEDVGGVQGTTTFTAVLTTDSGAVGSSTNQENAIQMTAYLVGGSAVDVDIIRQVSGRRYKVTDGTRTGIVALTSTLADAAGEGSVAVLDSAGGEYFATKITAHRVTLTRAGGSGHLYATNQQAPWSFDAPTGIYVQVANA